MMISIMSIYKIKQSKWHSISSMEFLLNLCEKFLLRFRHEENSSFDILSLLMLLKSKDM